MADYKRFIVVSMPVSSDMDRHFEFGEIRIVANLHSAQVILKAWTEWWSDQLVDLDESFDMLGNVDTSYAWESKVWTSQGTLFWKGVILPMDRI